MDLKYWQEASHTLARSKGWYAEYDKSTDERWRGAFEASRVQLILNEIAEASEELRDGRPMLYWEGGIKLPEEKLGPGARKPEGFAIELADVFLRAVDFAEMESITLEWDTSVEFCAYHISSSVCLNACLLSLSGALLARYFDDEVSTKDMLSALVSGCRALCEAVHKDHTFEEIVRIKHTYNLTRPNMHGKGF